MYKIGIDCRPLLNPFSGIGRYTKELITRLSEDLSIEWHFYFNKPPPLSFNPPAKAILHTNQSSMSRPDILWYHHQLPKLLVLDDIQLFWSPRHHLPVFLPRKVISVVTIHDLTWIIYPETMKMANFWSEKLQMSPSIKKADRIITISNSTLKDIEFHFEGVANKTSLISCGSTPLPPPEFVPGIPEDYLLFVGTPEPRKNLLRLISAYSKLSTSIKNQYPLVIVGNNGWKLSLNKIQNASDETEVIFKTDISDAQLSYIYSKCRLILMPSLYEGFGLPIIEAFRFRKPAVSSFLSSMPEIVGNAGLLVNPEKESEITAAIEKLLTDAKLYERCSKDTITQLSMYNWDKSANQMLSLFGELLRLN